MSTLSINAHLKFIEFLLHTMDQADETVTLGDIKNMFQETFHTTMPRMMDQNFGIMRLVPLLLMRESLKNAGSPRDKRIDIVRHALAHDGISANETGYRFSCDKGSVEFSYDEFQKFLHVVENDFFSSGKR